jgi:hypothetical protein
VSVESPLRMVAADGAIACRGRELSGPDPIASGWAEMRGKGRQVG